MPPDSIAMHIYRRTSQENQAGYFGLAIDAVKIALFAEDQTPRWIEHPTYGHKVDVAVLDVSNEIAGYYVEHVNLLESDAILDLFASQDIFVVGFPFGRMINAPAPLWKRGTIALDPTFDADGLPKMLVDSSTRPGMSGSVVIARHVLVGRDYAKKDGTRSRQVLYSRMDTVIGVYSGRHYPDLEKAQLGIVWKRSVIEEAIAGQKLGSVDQ